MAFKVRRKKTGVPFKQLLKETIALALLMFVGAKVLGAIGTSFGSGLDTNGYFYAAFQFLGMSTNTASQTTGMIAIIGIMAVASLVLRMVDVSF